LSFFDCAVDVAAGSDIDSAEDALLFLLYIVWRWSAQRKASQNYIDWTEYLHMGAYQRM